MSDGFDRGDRHDSYLAYTDALMNAVGFATLGALTMVVGFDWAASSLAVETMGDWFTVDAEPGFLYGSFVSSLGTVLLVIGNQYRMRAKVLRSSWKARELASLAYTTMVATVILQTLTEASDDV